jgi:hypothetical protein
MAVPTSITDQFREPVIWSKGSQRCDWGESNWGTEGKRTCNVNAGEMVELSEPYYACCTGTGILSV